ncbi:MAG: adenosylcobinamide-GDP ribazoletransferase [Oscillospiraceae bacterium]|nr:adenosylcobinamide-GDP ribazoletransferase [Oscillospiraceae bacterium]
MRTFFQTIGVAFGMFSKVPVPRTVWNDKNMRYMFLAFPLVGLLIGLFWFGWLALANWLTFPDALTNLGFVAIPVLVTGGIHMDGYSDTVDALSSYSSPKRRREIMQDPHVGSFAVIRVVLYFLTYYLLIASLSADGKTAILIGLSFMYSRALTGLAAANFRLAKNTGLAHTFSSRADKKTVTIWLSVFAIAILAGMIACNVVGGLTMLVASLIVFFHYYQVAERKFEGITGDLSGWFLQKCEWWMMFALVVGQVLEAKIAA